jgi:hypothetical protein
MLRRQACAQRADAAGADDGDAQLLALDGRLLERADILTSLQFAVGSLQSLPTGG